MKLKFYHGKILRKRGWYIKYDDLIENLSFYLETVLMKNPGYILEKIPIFRVKENNREVCTIIPDGIYTSIFVFDKKFLKILKLTLRRRFRTEPMNLYTLNLNTGLDLVEENVKNFLRKKILK